MENNYKMAYTENGALSYSTTGVEIIDQFGKAGAYRFRDIETVWEEQDKLWEENPEYAIKFPFYLRMISRKIKISDNIICETMQMGQGAKDESFKRLLWIAHNHSDIFYKNLWLLPVIGSWKDMWVLMNMDGTLDRNRFYDCIMEGLLSESQVDLAFKYMPRIRSNNKCTTEWAKNTNQFAKEFCHKFFISYDNYRKMKTTGKAHEFQQVICSRRYDELNWNLIPGKALLNLVSGNFLYKHDLVESYLEWLSKQDTVKFNGYPYELGHALRLNHKPVNIFTINKQFDNLVKNIKENNTFNGNVLCALDTSGSMSWCNLNGGITPYDICISLGIYFSELNEGDFHNVVAMFDDTSHFLKFSGDTFAEKWDEIRASSCAMGSTNFQSLIDLIVRTRIQHPEININDYPSTILVVSDMQFNNCGDETNIELARRKLKDVFPEEYIESLKFIWWNCCGRATNDMPSTADDKNSFFFSGFDGSVVSMVIGGKEEDKKEEKRETKTIDMEDVIKKAFSQEIFKYFKIS